MSFDNFSDLPSEPLKDFTADEVARNFEKHNHEIPSEERILHGPPLPPHLKFPISKSPNEPEKLNLSSNPLEDANTETVPSPATSGENSSKSWFRSPTWNFPKWPSMTKKPPCDISTEKANIPLGFSFSPAGLLLPYHLGVVSVLQNKGYLTENTNLAGSSAGALAACCAAAEIDPRAFLQLFKVVQKDLRTNGAAGRLYEILNRELESILPDDIHERIAARPGKTIIAHAILFPPCGQFIDKFHSRKDLIENLLASCNIPFYFAKTPTVSCRKNQAVDGYFAVSRKYFGCPPAGKGVTTIRVLPFRADQMRMKRSPGEFIAPDLQDKDYELHANGSLEKLKKYLELNPVTKWSLTHVALKMPPEIVEYFKQIHPNDCEEDSSKDEVEDEFESPPNDRKNSLQLSEFSKRFSDGNISVSDQSLPSGTVDAKSKFQLPIEMNPFAMLINKKNQPPPRDESVPPLPGVPTLKWSPWELLRIALDPSDDLVLDELFELGRADSFRWCQLRELQKSEDQKV
eukprot:GHVP01013284.1.p1 GENE.GHVP01013284.1~~GHVP01013284.1.p1  ORF type:complete len:527 (+),score=107.45 GHVP01013284.1:32-1582(+)